jgi:hypothetical protein
MLDEIIPALKPSKRLKMLAAEPELTGVLPEVDSKISFLPLINYLQEKRSEVSNIKEQFYNYLIRKFESEPDLTHTINYVEILEEHSDLLELLSTTLFPVVSKHEKVSFALAAPYQFKVFYYSDCFRQLFMDVKEEHLLLPSGMTAKQLKEIESSMIYDHVLEKFYGIKLNDSPELIYPIADSETGLKRYFKIRYDRRFIDVHLKGKLPPIQDCAVCMNTFRILDLEKQLAKMPLDLFEIEGFAVWVAEDVTKAEAIETIKKILLNQHEYTSNIINELKAAVHVLVGLNEVEIGLMPFIKINKQFILEEEFTRHSIVGRHWQNDDAKSMETFQAFIGFLQQHPEPVPVSLLNKDMTDFAPFLKPVYDSGVRSYIPYVMQNSDGFLGMLELASPIPNLLTLEVMSRLEPAVPLLSVALLKNRDTFYNRIEKRIKEKFTPLQQSVEWKFAEVAWNELRANGNGPSANVVFENVYPLYGAIDIRNSSLQRSSAIQKDLKEHLRLVDKTLDDLQALVSLPLLEGLKFKNQNVQSSIEEKMRAEDEVRINEFIESEVQPVFNHLHKSNSQLQEIVNNYCNKANDSNSSLYHYRREYEETLTLINDVVLQYLEQEEEQVQKSYPHYFERYRTDGVEYNIYIGQSIAPHHPFDVLYLKNIRLWQLKSMAEIALRTHKLLPAMQVPLETTQLILLHSQCITISFRSDERRFDVEGSYNIRYETTKKRLDKVCIKDTHERLTQPGKIAIVYSNQKEVQEYQEYIQFLQNKGILNPGIEMLELEELQGVHGLKAMRVSINMQV